MDAFYFHFNLHLTQWFRWQVTKQPIKKIICNRWVWITFDCVQWDIIGDIDNTLNCIDFPVQLKTFLFSPVLLLFLIKQFVQWGKKKNVRYKFHTLVYAVFLKEMYLDICHLQRYQNSDELRTTDSASPPYTVVQVVHYTSATS